MAEAITIIGLIGSIVNITEAIIETYKVARDTKRLPEAFRVVNERIPIVQRTLSIAESHYRRDEDEPAIRQSLTTCKQKAEDLRYIFDQVCSNEGDGILRRYRKALMSMKPGRGDKVENLFKDILDTLYTLHAFHIFKNVIPVDDLKAAIEEVVDVEPSMSESASTTIYSSGTGAMFNNGPGELSVKQVNGEGNYQAENIYFQSPAVWENRARNPTLTQPFHDPVLDRKRLDSRVYVPRPEALKNMEAKLQKEARRSGFHHAVLVHGMGGTGKTQLVLQYIERHKHEYTMIIWIDAESPGSFIYSCIRVSQALRLLDTRYNVAALDLVPQRSPPVDHFLSWLQNRPDNDNWLLVLDNVDDLTWGIRDVLPRGRSGDLIVTSRDSYTARTLGCVSFSLESMEMDEAKRFLQIAAFPDLEESSVELDGLCSQVAGLLDGLPLAVHLAAATISTDSKILQLEEDLGLNHACLAVERYIERFESSKDELLLSNDHHFMQSPYPRTVLTTFETTFRKLYEDDRPKWEPPPMKLLSLLAFLKEKEATSLHKRFQQAYSGIRLDKNVQHAYGASNLPRWLSKFLTGESSIELANMGQSSWDCSGYCATLNTLQRFGLIRPHANGLPEILPLHKIVRWRVQKEAENDIQLYRWHYTVMLELALCSQSSSVSESLDILSELAEYYRDLGQWQYAENCAICHLQRQIDRHGHCHAGTISSLVRLIEILGVQRPDDAEREIFRFVRDANDRQAVLEVLPVDLLLLLKTVFLRHPEEGKIMPKDKDKRLQWDREAIEFPRSVIGAGQALQKQALQPQALQKSTWSSIPLTTFQPALEAPGLPGRLAAQLDQRRQALKKAAKKQPDLVTLFEVFSMGSSDLLSDYMQYVDADTVRYRDPVGARTVLHFVAAYGDAKDVQRCIESGSDVNAADRYGATPLHVAGMVGRREVFRALTEANGSTFSADYNGYTPIQYAQKRPDVFFASTPLHGNPIMPEISEPRPMLDAKESSIAPHKIFDEMPSNSWRHAYVEDYDSDNSSQISRASAQHGSARSSMHAASLLGGRSKSPYDIWSHIEVPHSFYSQGVPQHMPSEDLESLDVQLEPSIAESCTGSCLDSATPAGTIETSPLAIETISSPVIDTSPPVVETSASVTETSNSQHVRDGEPVYSRSHPASNASSQEQEQATPITRFQVTEFEDTGTFQTRPVAAPSSRTSDSGSNLPDVHVVFSDCQKRQRSISPGGHELDTHEHFTTLEARREVVAPATPSGQEKERFVKNVSSGEANSCQGVDAVERNMREEQSVPTLDPRTSDAQTETHALDAEGEIHLSPPKHREPSPVARLSSSDVLTADTKPASSFSKQPPAYSTPAGRRQGTRTVGSAGERSNAGTAQQTTVRPREDKQTGKASDRKHRRKSGRDDGQEPLEQSRSKESQHRPRRGRGRPHVEDQPESSTASAPQGQRHRRRKHRRHGAHEPAVLDATPREQEKKRRRPENQSGFRSFWRLITGRGGETDKYTRRQSSRR